MPVTCGGSLKAAIMLCARPLPLRGLVELTPARHEDPRGFFMETYSYSAFSALGIDTLFIQDNHSLSRSAGVLRGLHYQLQPYAQAKLVRVIRGAIFDVAVDIRADSPDFGRWAGLELSAERGNQLFVPAGFAHGFVTLQPDTEVAYKVDHPYSPAHERGIRFDDPQIGIVWPRLEVDYTLSDKDRRAPLLSEAGAFR